MSNQTKKYTIGPFHPGLAAIAERRAAYCRHPKLSYHQETTAIIWTVAARRRVQLKRLYLAGWRMSRNGKHRSALACPPCGVFVRPRGLYRCCTRPCPFCWGRQVGEIYKRLLEFHKQHHGAQLYVWSQRPFDGPPDEHTIHYFRNLDDYDHSMVFNEVLRTMDRGRADFRRQCTGALGGVYQSFPTPRLLRPADIAAVPPPGDVAVRGTWELQRRAILFWDPLQPLPLPLGNFKRCRPRTARGFARLVGTTLCFPGEWLTADIPAMTAMLNWMGHKRTVSYFGGLAPHFQGVAK